MYKCTSGGSLPSSSPLVHAAARNFNLELDRFMFHACARSDDLRQAIWYKYVRDRTAACGAQGGLSVEVSLISLCERVQRQTKKPMVKVMRAHEQDTRCAEGLEERVKLRC